MGIPARACEWGLQCRKEPYMFLEIKMTTGVGKQQKYQGQVNQSLSGRKEQNSPACKVAEAQGGGAGGRQTL